MLDRRISLFGIKDIKKPLCSLDDRVFVDAL